MVPLDNLHRRMEPRAGSRSGLDEAVALLVKDYPDHEAPIRAFHERWHETVSGVIEDNVALLDRLRQAGVPTYCITNFSGPKFIEAGERFPFLESFDGVIVSGDERLLKPDAEIYYLLLNRYGLDAPDCVFIDDSKANVEAPERSACMRSSTPSPWIWRRSFAATASCLSPRRPRGPHERSSPMRAFDTLLPIDAVLADLTASLASRPNAVLVAPPAPARRPACRSRPRRALGSGRQAHRAGAAAPCGPGRGRSHGADPGRSSRRHGRPARAPGSKISRRTRIEVVTEGVFARMILDDPALDGVAAVLFDEFHERSLDADLGLALALDAQGGLRELRLLVMSATLDGARWQGSSGMRPSSNPKAGLIRSKRAISGAIRTGASKSRSPMRRCGPARPSRARS